MEKELIEGLLKLKDMENYEAKEVVIEANGLKLHGYGANVPKNLFDNEVTFYSLDYSDDSSKD